MKKISFAYLTLLLTFVFTTTHFAQKTELDEMPKPVGGIYAIAKNVVYPEAAKKDGIQGKVHVEAEIDELGNVVGTKILKSVGSGCDEAAMEAIKKTKFTAGVKDGKSVKAKIVIPIQFKLDGKKKDKKG